jgi:hypothetical protein
MRKRGRSQVSLLLWGYYDTRARVFCSVRRTGFISSTDDTWFSRRLGYANDIVHCILIPILLLELFGTGNKQHKYYNPSVSQNGSTLVRRTNNKDNGIVYYNSSTSAHSHTRRQEGILGLIRSIV